MLMQRTVENIRIKRYHAYSSVEFLFNSDLTNQQVHMHNLEFDARYSGNLLLKAGLDGSLSSLLEQWHDLVTYTNC